MLDGLIQSMAGGGVEDLEGEALHGGVAQMMQQAPNEHGIGAFGDALQSMGAGGFGSSVAQGATQGSPQQRNDMANMLLGAVEQGGGNPSSVLSQLGIGGGGNMGPNELGSLAQFVAANHGDALSGLMGNEFGNGNSGGGVMSLLGNPMVRQIGMNLAKKML